MKIVEVNYTDLPGRIFNGYDLHLTLNEVGHIAHQIVKDKRSNEKSVIQLDNNILADQQVKYIENIFSMSNLLGVYGKLLNQESHLINADVVHYHILKHNMISLLDLPSLMKLKPTVWSIHDPWMVTGNCIHPLHCKKWLDGCYECSDLNCEHFEMTNNKAYQMWNIKKNIYKELDIDLVVSTNFMKDYIEKSPLTQHIKKIHKIPFGLCVEDFDKVNYYDSRVKYNISKSDFVIGFRNEKNYIKGCQHILQVLREMEPNNDIVVITVGNKDIPVELRGKFRFIELGWQDDNQIMKEFFKMCDLFIMPSLAESFGLMAIEAMAAQSTVVCFKNTVVEEVTCAPKCGIAVKYGSSTALRYTIERLMKSPDECIKRGIEGRRIVKQFYQYKDYVQKHIELYQEVIERQKYKK